jgi:hypothetical protein
LLLSSAALLGLKAHDPSSSFTGWWFSFHFPAAYLFGLRQGGPTARLAGTSQPQADSSQSTHLFIADSQAVEIPHRCVIDDFYQ